MKELEGGRQTGVSKCKEPYACPAEGETARAAARHPSFTPLPPPPPLHSLLSAADASVAVCLLTHSQPSYLISTRPRTPPVHPTDGIVHSQIVQSALLPSPCPSPLPPPQSAPTDPTCSPLPLTGTPAPPLPHESFPEHASPHVLDTLKQYSTCEVSDGLLALDVKSGGFLPGTVSLARTTLSRLVLQLERQETD